VRLFLYTTDNRVYGLLLAGGSDSQASRDPALQRQDDRAGGGGSRASHQRHCAIQANQRRPRGLPSAAWGRHADASEALQTALHNACRFGQWLCKNKRSDVGPCLLTFAATFL